MKVITSPLLNGNKKVANHYTIEVGKFVYLQSYKSIIAKCPKENLSRGNLDKSFWDYSHTTRKYRNIFLGLSSKDVKNKIKSGDFILTDLNKKGHL